MSFFVQHSDQGVDFRDFVSAKTSDHNDESEGILPGIY